MSRSILIVDDHDRFRAVARRALEGDGWTVVGEAADGTSGLQAVDDLAPDIVLLDVGLPDMSGIEVLQTLHARAPQIDVVLVSTHDAEDYSALAASHGACGFLPKADLSGDTLSELLAAPR